MTISNQRWQYYSGLIFCAGQGLYIIQLQQESYWIIYIAKYDLSINYIFAKVDKVNQFYKPKCTTECYNVSNEVVV